MKARFILVFVLVAEIILVFLFFTFHTKVYPLEISETKLIPIPPILTLHYQTDYDAPGIVHNCLLALRAGANMHVYTDNKQYSYCRYCKCTQFEPTFCRPPKPGTRSNCEKMAFVSRMLRKLGEFVFLDADLVVLKPSFFRMIAARAMVHDFLASYAEETYHKPHKYYEYFNSGLMFIRDIPSANSSDLLPMMYRYGSGSDQSVMTWYIHKNYHNWDTLSWPFHCRGIFRLHIDVPLNACITVHDRGSHGRKLMHMLNYTLLKT